MNQGNFEIMSNPFGLIVFSVMIVSGLSMGCLAKDHLGAKGIRAYFLVATGWGILVYLRIRKEKKEGIGLLFWVFLASAVALYLISFTT